jgi:hypothetical protein
VTEIRRRYYEEEEKGVEKTTYARKINPIYLATGVRSGS